MKKVFTRVGLVGAAATVIAGVGASGIASADTMYASETSATTTSTYTKKVLYATDNNGHMMWWGHEGQHDQSQGDGWGSWDPSGWQHGDKSFQDWWGGVMGQLSQQSDGEWQSQNGGNAQDNGWMPNGGQGQWQDNWMMWDPVMWQQHGQSYQVWYSKFVAYLSANYYSMMTNWKGSSWQPMSWGQGMGNEGGMMDS